MWRWLTSPPQKHHWLLLAALLMIGFFAVIFLPRRHPLFPFEELWRRQDGGQPGYMRNIAFSSDGSQLISTNDKGLLIWRVQDGQLLQTFPLPAGSRAMLSPDGSVAALYKEDGTITLLRLPDGQPLCTIKEIWPVQTFPFFCIASSRCSCLPSVVSTFHLTVVSFSSSIFRWAKSIFGG